MAWRLIAALCILLATQVTGKSPCSDKPVLNCSREEITCNFSCRFCHLFAVMDGDSIKILCGCEFITVGLHFWPCEQKGNVLTIPQALSVQCSDLCYSVVFFFCLPPTQVLNVFPLSFSYVDYTSLALAYRRISASPCPDTVFSIFFSIFSTVFSVLPHLFPHS